MKVYEVECRAGITLIDVKKAALQRAALLMHNPQLVCEGPFTKGILNPVRSIQAGKAHHKFPFFVSTGNLGIRASGDEDRMTKFLDPRDFDSRAGMESGLRAQAIGPFVLQYGFVLVIGWIGLMN
jgi:hypothetical protein